jgi:hypothetical protein
VNKRQAVFVELPEGTDLSQSSFLYSQQYNEARRAALMPLDRFVAASRAIAPPAGLAFLFSTGRCGSTLASRILAQLPEVWSLSEPDCLTNIAVARNALGHEKAADLMRAATLWICRPPKGRVPETVVIKPRSEAVLVANACHRAFPESRNVFLYRDLIGYSDSVFKFVQRIFGQERFFGEAEIWRPDWDFLMAGVPISLQVDCFEPDHGPIGFEEFATLMWDLRIDGYLRAVRRGMNFTAVHYDDLNRDRAEQTARLLSGCGLSARHLDKAMAGFIEDSHKGSVGANTAPARPMNAEERARAMALLVRLGKRDYVETRLPE